MPEPVEHPSFGSRLRELRRTAGLSQDELAERASLSVSAISALERGERRQPYPHTVRALAEALRLSEDERLALLRSAGRAPAPLQMPPPARRSRNRPWRVAAAPIVAIAASLLGQLVLGTDAGDSGGPGPRIQSLRVLLPVPFHSQQQTNWADPADLEMWLRFDHAGGLPADDAAAQSTLWGYETSHNDGFALADWDCSPYAVAATYDHFVGADTVGDDTFASADAAGTVIAGVVGGRHEPVVALVDGASTYVLVVGVMLGPGGIRQPPLAVVVDDPYPAGEARPGGISLGQEAQLSWPAFVSRFTPVPATEPGVWSGHWVLIATGLPLRG